MTYPDAARDHYAFIEGLTAVTAAAVQRVWGRMGADFDPSWAAVGPRAAEITARAQLAAAQRAQVATRRSLDQLGVVDRPVADVDVRPLAGVAADGRSLEGLLAGAVGRAKQVTESTGAAPAVALAAGGRWLGALAASAVVDASRSAVQAEIVVRERVGWVRQVNPPCCGNCAVLAGRWYRWNAAFDRHPPTCKCTQIPAPEDMAGELTTSPQLLLERGMVRGLTKDQEERLAKGEDPTAVLNRPRDMWRARVQDQKRRDTAGDAPRDEGGRASMAGVLDALNRDVARARMERMGLLR